MNKFVGLFLIVTGILSLIKPEMMAMFGERWKYKNAEPSEMNIGLTKISGGLSIFIGILLLFS
ncbi:hypothetical protein EZV73_15370 [Acidaminobacter sp. JC074]|uniref:DUF6199 family natural product biosynthesis protein n=1 Tax=Acidaminobacter sp. JC074 TaxID=2530199 RepID=UPI001F0D8FE0|nr:DUF6199 family natural product biosynthesis protein [Acidaminobacter sp. JC074]MCH4888973.1 hypothetical protein [Acidaminobacter sp. JC074]